MVGKKHLKLSVDTANKTKWRWNWYLYTKPQLSPYWCVSDRLPWPTQIRKRKENRRQLKKNPLVANMQKHCCASVQFALIVINSKRQPECTRHAIEVTDSGNTIRYRYRGRERKRRRVSVLSCWTANCRGVCKRHKTNHSHCGLFPW